MRLQLIVSPGWLLLTVVLTFNNIGLAKELTLPAIFSDGMVLQRTEPVPVWGWADPGATVVVEFNAQRRTTTTGDDGTWKVKLNAMEASSTGQNFVVDCGNDRITISDVVVGEVWLCSGQSNMSVTLSFLVNSPVKDDRYQPVVDVLKREMETATDPLLRQFKVTPTGSPLKELETVEGVWKSSSPENNPKFTGAGYYFAKELRQRLKVPVGIINSSFPGTPIEFWIPRSGYMRFDSLKEKCETSFERIRKNCEAWDPAVAEKEYEEGLRKWEAGGRKGRRPRKPKDPARSPIANASLYNAMIHPVLPYAMKGAIWYQGESNSSNPGKAAAYGVALDAMVTAWRERSGQDLSFYFAQLASFNAKSAEGRAWIADAMRQSVSRIDDTGMAILCDVGEYDDVHPKNKIDVGKRLALWALKND